MTRQMTATEVKARILALLDDVEAGEEILDHATWQDDRDARASDGAALAQGTIRGHRDDGGGR